MRAPCFFSYPPNARHPRPASCLSVFLLLAPSPVLVCACGNELHLIPGGGGKPFPGMSLKVGHKHVDQSGLVYLPYLHEWTARTHNLVELIANMSSVFGAEPPVS